MVTNTTPVDARTLWRAARWNEMAVADIVAILNRGCQFRCVMYLLWYAQTEPMSKKHAGSSIDDFLKKENIFAEAQAQAVKEVVAWQLAKAMKKKKISKARMAVLLKTSRSQVDRILDPKRDITLSSLQRAAALVGQRVVIELV
jgi:antitoxin HicB